MKPPAAKHIMIASNKNIIRIIFNIFLLFGFDFTLSNNLAIPRIKTIPIVMKRVNSNPNTL